VVKLNRMPAFKPSAARRRSVFIGVVVFFVLGLAHLGMLLIGAEHGWFAWTTPFAFWGVAYLAYRRELRGDDEA